MIKKDKEILMKKFFYVDKNGYVYRSIPAYDKSKKQARPEKIYVGIRGSDDKHFYPNKRYFELYPDERPVKRSEAPIQSDSIAVGNHVVYSKIADDTCLLSALEAGFVTEQGEIDLNAEKNSRLALDLACYMVDEECSDMQHFPGWVKKNAVFSDEAVTDSAISAFLTEDITNTTRERFLSSWSGFHKTDDENERIYICYDSTNFNSASRGITLLEKGYAKDDITKLQFNFECVVRSRDGLPLAYDTFPGSVIDLKQCRKMITLMKNLGYKKITFVCDRGYISEENIRTMKKEGYSFIFMVKDNLVMKKEIVAEYGDKIRDRSSCFFREYDLFGMTVKDVIYKDIEVYHHIFYTSEITRADREAFYSGIDAMEEDLRGLVGMKLSASKRQMEKSYGRFFDLSYGEEQGQKLILLAFSKNSEKVDAEYRKLSFFTLITSDDMTIPDVLEQYKLRDRVEKCFMMIKTSTRMKTLKTHSDVTLQAKVFLCFVASIIRSVLVDRTRSLREATKDSKSYTVPACLGQLSNIEATRTIFSDRREIRYTLTNRQKRILESFGLNEAAFYEMAGKIEDLDTKKSRK